MTIVDAPLDPSLLGDIAARLAAEALPWESAQAMRRRNGATSASCAPTPTRRGSSTGPSARNWIFTITGTRRARSRHDPGDWKAVG